MANAKKTKEVKEKPVEQVVQEEQNTESILTPDTESPSVEEKEKKSPAKGKNSKKGVSLDTGNSRESNEGVESVETSMESESEFDVFDENSEDFIYRMGAKSNNTIRRNLNFVDENNKPKKAYELSETELFLNDAYKNYRILTGEINKNAVLDDGTPSAEVTYSINGKRTVAYIPVQNMGFSYVQEIRENVEKAITPDMEQEQKDKIIRSIFREANYKYTNYIKNFIGSTVDFMVVGLSPTQEVIVNRNLAMVFRRRNNYFRTRRNAEPRVSVGATVSARVLLVTKRYAMLEIYGVVCYAPIRTLTSVFCTDLRTKYNQGQVIDVKILDIKNLDEVTSLSNYKEFANQSKNIKIEFIATKCEEEERIIAERLEHYKVGETCIATVAGIGQNGQIYMIFEDGVKCIASRYDGVPPYPNVGDRVLIGINAIDKKGKGTVYSYIKRVTSRQLNSSKNFI